MDEEIKKRFEDDWDTFQARLARGENTKAVLMDIEEDLKELGFDID
ncbi:hypothetical protein HY449_01090 [Candidatus Pacearchaeota archaeon]|nr:hypothetical protein [Candidatus Pacearchaeota archaeon]